MAITRGLPLGTAKRPELPTGAAALGGGPAGPAPSRLYREVAEEGKVEL
jgi:hypothetical protein